MEADRQKQLEEQQRKEQEEAKRKREEFEKTKQDVLKNMKGIAENGLGLKDVRTTDSLGLKGIGDAKVGTVGLKGIGDSGSRPSVDATTVDLRHLDPNKSITVDPNVVKGQQRVFPVQTDPETLQNANYNKGFDAILRGDPASAVRCFEQAGKERPGDPLVHNALLLAEGLVKVYQQKDRAAMKLAGGALDAVAHDDYDDAIRILKQAQAISPDNPNIADTLRFVQGVKAKDDSAIRYAANACKFVKPGEYDTAIGILKHAQTISPNNPNIADTLRYVQGEKKRDEDAIHVASDAIHAIGQDDYDKAIRMLKQAHDMKPDDPQISDTLTFVEGMATQRANAAKQTQPNRK
jgi:tetratricopeptide (TPR) repeat protein